MRLLLSAVAGAVLVLAFLGTVGYQPANAADGPASDPADAMVRAFVEACRGSGGLPAGKAQGGVWVMSCTENLGMGPSVRRATR